jgi:hypothetical protein
VCARREGERGTTGDQNRKKAAGQGRILVTSSTVERPSLSSLSSLEHAPGAEVAATARS